MNSEPDPRAALAILQDARTMQATNGAAMIRQAVSSVLRSITRLLHVQRVAIGHTTVG